MWNPNETPEERAERRRKNDEVTALRQRIEGNKRRPDELKADQVIWLDRWAFKGLYRVVKVTPKTNVIVAKEMDWIRGGFRETGKTVRIPAYHTPQRRIWDRGPCQRVTGDFSVVSNATLRAFRLFLRTQEAERESQAAVA